jgi:anti-anti-sigma regulatory factor
LRATDDGAVLRQDDVIVLSVVGDIDGVAASRLRTAIARAFDRLLVVSLTQVTLLGSPGFVDFAEQRR